MKRFLVAALWGVFASLLLMHSLEARPRQKASAERLSVLDYYFLLPGIGNFGNATRRERQELLRPDPEVGPVIEATAPMLSLKARLISKATITDSRFINCSAANCAM